LSVTQNNLVFRKCFCGFLSKPFIDQFRKEVAVYETRSPLGVVNSGWLCGHYCGYVWHLFLFVLILALLLIDLYEEFSASDFTALLRSISILGLNEQPSA
jgi:hypothetical protein